MATRELVDLLKALNTDEASEVDILKHLPGTGHTPQLARERDRPSKEADKHSRRAKSSSIEMGVTLDEAKKLLDAGAHEGARKSVVGPRTKQHVVMDLKNALGGLVRGPILEPTPGVLSISVQSNQQTRAEGVVDEVNTGDFDIEYLLLDQPQ